MVVEVMAVVVVMVVPVVVLVLSSRLCGLILDFVLLPLSMLDLGLYHLRSWILERGLLGF